MNYERQKKKIKIKIKIKMKMKKKACDDVMRMSENSFGMKHNSEHENLVC